MTVAYVKGVDVAAPYQNSNFPDNHLAFVFIKATQNDDYVNPELDAMVDHALKSGSLVFLYHFMGTASAASQVAWFRKKAGHQVKAGRVVGVDWEALKGVWPSNALKDETVHGFQAAYPDNRIVLYTNKDGWLNHDKTSVRGHGLWLAAPGPIGVTGIKTDVAFQQYGIQNNLDLDVAFFPSQAALKEWANPVSDVNPIVVPIPNATYDAVWRDDVMTPPEGLATDANPKWQAESVLLKIANLGLENAAAVAKLQADVTAILAKLNTA
jgi:GH25 family lysozyme M1 (1,4-beta-N-acetylmuramidase)